MPLGRVAFQPRESFCGGTINTGNITVFPNFPWDNGPVYGNTTTIDCNASPCPIMSVDRHLTTPYVWNWTLSMQHAFTPNLTLEMAYVGNHGGNLTGIRDINQPPVGSGWHGPPRCAHDSALVQRPGIYDNCEQRRLPSRHRSGTVHTRKFPYLGNIFQMGNVYQSNYNGLQVTLNSRNYPWLEHGGRLHLVALSR